MATAAKNLRQPKALPAPYSDFYELVETLDPKEVALVTQVRTFMESKVAPIINEYSEEQNQKWLPPMVRFEKFGCFGLIEDRRDD